MPSASAPTSGLSIGKLGKRTGCKVQTVRYYEQIGLMPKPRRTEGKQRLYREDHLKRLAFIRHNRELGFPLQSIRDLLKLSDDPNRSCEQADRIATVQLKEVEVRIERLAMLKTELEPMLQQCGHGRIAECRVIEVLADHSKCVSHSQSGAAKSI